MKHPHNFQESDSSKLFDTEYSVGLQLTFPSEETRSNSDLDFCVMSLVRCMTSGTEAAGLFEDRKKPVPLRYINTLHTEHLYTSQGVASRKA